MNTNRGSAKGVLSVALGVVMILGAATAVSAKGKEPIVQGGVLEFQLPDLSGTLVSSGDPRFAGKVLLINLWATWCQPCITEIPTLVELQALYGDSGLVIVGIAFEAEERADRRLSKLQRFVAQRGINYLILDGGQPGDFEVALPSVKNVQGFPVEILVDRAGRVVVSRNGYGYRKKWRAKLTREIEALLSSSLD